MHANGLWAREKLRESGRSMSARDIEILTLMATGSEDAAQDAKAKRILELMAKFPDKTPEV
jgi:hypothetical protein